jgi:hypothetical protein
MRIITVSFLLIMLIFSPAISAQDESGPDESRVQGEFIRESEAGEDEKGAGLPVPSRHGSHKNFGKKGMRGPGGRSAGIQFKQFRKEVKALGSEIKENKLMIQSLEEELEMIEPGLPRAEVRKKLNEYRLREAELQVELARKRVDFTRRARDLAQERYDQARLGMERVKEKIKRDYPDLSDRLAPDMNHQGSLESNPDF